MPELPEVETIRRQLESQIVGKRISSIKVLSKGSFRGESESLIGKTVTRIERKGKVLIIRLDKNRSLYTHLKMSGRLAVGPQHCASHSRGLHPRVMVSQVRGSDVTTIFPLEKPVPSEKGDDSKHLRVIIGFADGMELRFIDQRKFGFMTTDSAVLPKGMDAISPELTTLKLQKILSGSKKPIKTLLLDQSKIAGIGNIYASEILWESRINPRSGVSGKSGRSGSAKRRIGKLQRAIRKVLNEAIRYGGATMRDQLYRRIDGEKGGYQGRFRVYDREGESCWRCGSKIKKIRQGQRSTYYCQKCQKDWGS